MFTCLYVPSRSSSLPRFRIEHPSAARSVTDTLVRLAREFSPRVEVQGEHLVMLDTSGLGDMVGDARAVGDALRRAAADRGLCARVAVATTRMAALLAVQGRAGLTVIPPGLEAASLASLPLGVLKALAEIQASGASKAGQARPPLALPAFALLSTVRWWGLKTLGDLAALPSADLFERLGAGGLMLQRLARGEDDRPLVPDPVEDPLEASVALEWPIEGLEPLSFVLRRLFETLCARLERGRVGAAVLHVRLWLVTRVVHARTLQFPAPLRDPRVLRTLVLLDLESHPPSAGIDRVAIVVDPVPTRVLQCSTPNPDPQMYIELHTSSAFSFLDGASLPEKLVERAAALGYPALALLDRDGVYGAPRFHQAARAAGIKPIIGCELTVGVSRASREAPPYPLTPNPQPLACGACPSSLSRRRGTAISVVCSPA